MIEWAESVIDGERPALVFAQETSPEWLRIWRRAGYGILSGRDRGWRMSTVLLHRPEMTLEPLPDHVWPNAYYHGSYIAAAVWTDAPAGPVVLCSVHASPAIAQPATYGWVGEVPLPRDGGGDPRWTPRTLWDSDCVAASLIAMSQNYPLLAAGDFNEARDDVYVGDNGPCGTWGAEYFDRLEHAGLLDVSLIEGREELRTRGGLQLDHVLVSETAQPTLAVGSPRLDPAWSEPGHERLSDHTALWFDINIRDGEEIRRSPRKKP
jgi:hypothetical protein